MYKYEHGVQVMALGVVAAPILRGEKEFDAFLLALTSILVADDPFGQGVTIIIKRSTAPWKTALYISHNFRLPYFYVIFFVLVLPEVVLSLVWQYH